MSYPGRLFTVSVFVYFGLSAVVQSVATAQVEGIRPEGSNVESFRAAGIPNTVTVKNALPTDSVFTYDGETKFLAKTANKPSAFETKYGTGHWVTVRRKVADSPTGAPVFKELPAAIQLARTDSKNGIWRVTELSAVENEIFAVTTSLGPGGTRSKTSCHLAEGKVASCVTASRIYCERFKTAYKAQRTALDLESDGMQLARTCAGEGSRSSECKSYIDLLLNVADPNKILVDVQRLNRDKVVTEDIDALEEFKASVPTDPFKRMDLSSGVFSSAIENKTGASSTGMKERFERLSSAVNTTRGKSIKADLMALNRLTTMCLTSGFIDEAPVTAPKVNSTRK